MIEEPRNEEESQRQLEEALLKSYHEVMVEYPNHMATNPNITIDVL